MEKKNTYTEKNTIYSIRQRAKSYFDQTNGCHGWDHTERVCRLALKIAEQEDADIDVIRIATLLHDIARPEQDSSNGSFCHAEKGAELAGNILEAYDIPDDKKTNIIHCIRTHRFRGKNIPETREAMILYDADKLDAIGAIGIGRAFQFSGEVGAKLHDKDVDTENTKIYDVDDTAYREFLVKLSKIKDKMLTAEGKRFAEERHDFMTTFFDRMNKESDGLL